eukprot:1185493-Pyramimonas_sp.AAC.1
MSEGVRKMLPELLERVLQSSALVVNTCCGSVTASERCFRGSWVEASRCSSRDNIYQSSWPACFDSPAQGALARCVARARAAAACGVARGPRGQRVAEADAR